MVMDIPSHGIFSGNYFENEGFKRKIKVEEIKDGLYQYDEQIKIVNGAGEDVTYQDSFPIKYWEHAKILHLLEKKGFKMEEELSVISQAPDQIIFSFAKMWRAKYNGKKRI